MLILTQNKKRIVNLDNISNIYYNGLAILAKADDIYTLGTYSSTERCKEILEEILDFYQDISVPNSVYYMPEE